MTENSWVHAVGLADLPTDLVLGSQEVIDTSPTVHLVYLYVGLDDDTVVVAPRAMAPGWYLLGRPASSLGRPLAGPFHTADDARYAWEMSKRHISHGMAQTQHFGFMAQSAIIYDPTVVLKPEALVMGQRSRIDAFCKIEGGEGVLLGDYVHIASYCHLGIGGGVVIFEDGASAGSGSKVLSGSASFDGPSWSATHPQVVNKKTTTLIRKNATLLVNSVVLFGCDIGEGATIGAGAVVTANTVVPPGEVWVGVPARRLR